MPLAVNNVLALGVVDTGSCKTLMDEVTALDLGLPMKGSLLLFN